MGYLAHYGGEAVYVDEKDSAPGAAGNAATQRRMGATGLESAVSKTVGEMYPGSRVKGFDEIKGLANPMELYRDHGGSATVEKYLRDKGVSEEGMRALIKVAGYDTAGETKKKKYKGNIPALRQFYIARLGDRMTQGDVFRNYKDPKNKRYTWDDDELPYD